MLRRLLDGLTIRGRSFIAAGIAAAACGLGIPEPDLVRIGLLLMALPLLSAWGAGRARYRLSCVRTLTPSRVPAGQQSTVSVTVSNVSKLRTGLLLCEDTVPYALGSRPRFVFAGIGGGGSRSYRFELGTGARGKYVIGPLRVRVADSFGLVSITRAFTATSLLTVTPRIVPLSRPPLAGNWLGDSEHGKRTIAATGDDDVTTRQYQTGDSLHRVHWKSTARRGELMVRREEQHWRNTASLFLDTRRAAYLGDSALFELAVTAAASIGVHMAGEGFDARFVLDTGEVPRQGAFQDTLLDTLAVVKPSRGAAGGSGESGTAAGIGPGLAALSAAGGQVIAVVGALSAAEARELAATRRGTTPGLALLLGPDAFGAGGDGSGGAAAEVLIASGWRAAAVPDAERLASAWEELNRDGSGRRATDSMLAGMRDG